MKAFEARAIRKMIDGWRESGPTMGYSSEEGQYENGREAGMQAAADEAEEFMATVEVEG
jgi:hypothetical protein